MASTGYFGFARGFSQFWKKGRKSSNVVTPTVMASTGQSECGGGLQFWNTEKNEESAMIMAKELLEAKEPSGPSLSLAEYYVWKELFSLLSRNVPHDMQTILERVREQDRKWYEQKLQELVEAVQQGHNKLKELPPIKIAESFSLYVKSPYGPEGIDGVSQDSIATLEWCYLDPVEHSEYFASPEHFLKSLRTVEGGPEGRSRFHEDVISRATMTLPLTKEDLDPDAILTIADKYRIPESVHRTMLTGFRDLALNPKDPRHREALTALQERFSKLPSLHRDYLSVMPSQRPRSIISVTRQAPPNYPESVQTIQTDSDFDEKGSGQAITSSSRSGGSWFSLLRSCAGSRK